jgi:hypothetical protein
MKAKFGRISLRRKTPQRQARRAPERERWAQKKVTKQ